MKYKLINKSISSDTNVFDVINHPEETNPETGEVTKEGWTETKSTTRYVIGITLNIQDTESLNTNVFEQSLIVESDNSETGFEVDAQREKAVNDFMDNLNK